MTYIDANWQCIFEDLPDALKALSCDGCSPANSDQELHCSSEAAAGAVAYKPRGAESGLLVRTAGSDI